ncbi:DUF4314 domain-containing protein [Eubacteriaceae bacterium ES2]|nr:DUF4314 domain-containing protein [Eubacteriaceae bacterium ES2]
MKKGTRIRLISMDDPYSSLTKGETGTVELIDDMGTIHVAWDTGSRLGLIPGVDHWEVIQNTTKKENGEQS